MSDGAKSSFIVIHYTPSLVFFVPIPLFISIAQKKHP
jgi:hypothetical protein